MGYSQAEESLYQMYLDNFNTLMEYIFFFSLAQVEYEGFHVSECSQNMGSLGYMHMKASLMREQVSSCPSNKASFVNSSANMYRTTALCQALF